MVFLQGLVANGLVYMVLPTIERRFQLKSLETGTIVSMYHVASCISAPVVTLLAAKRSKPLFLSMAAIVIGIGTMVLTLPHFLAPQYRYETNKNSIYFISENTSIHHSSIMHVIQTDETFC